VQAEPCATTRLPIAVRLGIGGRKQRAPIARPYHTAHRVRNADLWYDAGGALFVRRSSYVAIGCLLSIAAAAATGAIMQLMSEVFEGAGRKNAIFSGLCHTLSAVSLVFFKSVYGPLWYVHPFSLSRGVRAPLAELLRRVGQGRNLEHRCTATGGHRGFMQVR
jgi:hypothetical protein